jgi:Na+/phosphate symporter
MPGEQYMASDDEAPVRKRAKSPLAFVLGLLLLTVYLALPEADERAAEERTRDDAADESDRLEIRHISPPDPYPGSSILVSYGPKLADAVDARERSVEVYAGKTKLPVLASRDGEILARLPRELSPGTLKIRLGVEASGVAAIFKHDRSKPYQVRIKAPNWRKVFRSLLGGVALIALGIALLSRGVRESTDLDAARAVTRFTRVRGVAYGVGTLMGALAQSTTSAASVLAALFSSGVLPLVPAAVAFLGAQCGATIAPLLVTGFIEPREGLVAIAIGTLWLFQATDRRAAALGRLVLGAGFVAFGLQTFRPGLEPFLSSPMLMALSDTLRADTPANVALCAAIGTLLVAALQGPAALIVLILGVAHTTGHWDLTTALSLLAGTGLGSALAATLTASAGSEARRLARLHLWLGGASTFLAASTVGLWTHVAALLLGAEALTGSGALRGQGYDLGVPLAVAFGLSQLSSAFVLAMLTSRLSQTLERLGQARGAATRTSSLPSDAENSFREELARIMGLQQEGLVTIAKLTESGSRSYGRRAEKALSEARTALESLVRVQISSAQANPDTSGFSDGALGASAFACLQLQHSLDALLGRAERVTEARVAESVHADAPLTRVEEDSVLRELHTLVSEGLLATRNSLMLMDPPDLDEARAREIRINRLESHARSLLRQASRSHQLFEHQRHVLRVIDGYEVVGNQVYRLTEAMGLP